MPPGSRPRSNPSGSPRKGSTSSAARGELGAPWQAMSNTTLVKVTLGNKLLERARSSAPQLSRACNDIKQAYCMRWLGENHDLPRFTTLVETGLPLRVWWCMAGWSMRYPHLARYRRRQFCELGLQTSHSCSIIFPPYRVPFPRANS